MVGIMSAKEALPEPLLAFDSFSTVVEDALRRVDALQIRYSNDRKAGRILANVVEAMRVELTYHSNAIEGNTLSLRDTQLVLEGLAPSGGKSMRELYEARNHDRALREIEKWVADRPALEPISDRDLLDVHAMVLADIDLSAAGRFRNERVLIAGTGFVPPGSRRFPDLIPRMMELANRPAVHPVVQAAELHYNVVAVHPFVDGNGRAARLIMNLLLLRRGFPHTILDVSDRGEYLAALDETNSGRSERFTLFIANSVQRSIQRIVGG
jgi:Fic family protein